jgi:hypothetical protein
MPTDIALVLMRKAQAEAQASKEGLTDLIIVCLWAALGLAFMALMFKFGFEPTLVQALVVNG